MITLFSLFINCRFRYSTSLLTLASIPHALPSVFMRNASIVGDNRHILPTDRTDNIGMLPSWFEAFLNTISFSFD